MKALLIIVAIIVPVAAIVAYVLRSSAYTPERDLEKNNFDRMISRYK